MFLQIVLLIIGFVLLLKGADWTGWWLAPYPWHGNTVCRIWLSA